MPKLHDNGRWSPEYRSHQNIVTTRHSSVDRFVFDTPEVCQAFADWLSEIDPKRIDSMKQESYQITVHWNRKA